MILLLVYRDRHVILLEFEKETCCLKLVLLKTYKCKKKTCPLNLVVLKTKMFLYTRWVQTRESIWQVD